MKKLFIIYINFLMILVLSLFTNLNNIIAYGENIPIDSSLNGYYSKFKSMNVPRDKIFTINFNKEIDEKSITKDTLMVIDKNGKIMNTESNLCTDNKSIALLPPKEGYTEGEQYAILIKKGIKALDSSVIKKQVVMIFTVKSKEDLEKEKINNNKPIKKDSIETIVKTLEGNRSGNQKKGFYESEDPDFWLYLPRDYKKYNEFSKDQYHIWHYNDYVASMKTFNNKYKNKNYENITDIDYYKKIPNLSINFNNCNNDNIFISSSLGCEFDSKIKEDFPKNYSPTFFTLSTKEKGYYRANIDLIEDKSNGFPLCQFIWRPDLEKQMVEEVNQRRKAKGLKPLTLSNDLTAIGKYSAKRSYLCFSYYYLGYKLPCSTTCNFKCWANGTVPYACIYTDNVDLDVQEAICLEDHSKELFGYNKPVKCISESSCIFKNAKDFINNWEQQQLFDEGKNPNYSANFKSYMKHYPESVPKEKYHAPIKLEKNIYNPNVTEIGVGCIYAPPLAEGDINGCIGYFIVLS